MSRKLRSLVLLLLMLMLTTMVPTFTTHASGPSSRIPVIVIPGIGGSTLGNQSDLIWVDVGKLVGSNLPGFNLLFMNWLKPLRLAADGSTPWSPSYQIEVGDILRQPIVDGYSGMVRALTNHGYLEGKDLRLMPYDWRKDPALATEQLGRLVDQTLAETGAQQVVLVGHSLGGVIARDYIVGGGGPKVKASIAIGTPWLGTPIAYRALKYGWDLGMRIPIANWSLFAPSEVRSLVQNYPSVYSLAPKSAYFDWYADGYLNRGGRWLSHAQTVNTALAAHNRALALKASAAMERQLDGKDHGVAQFIIAGTGRSTLGAIVERTDWLGITDKSERMVDGDEVVPLLSADLGHSKDPDRAAAQIGSIAGIAYVNQTHILLAQSFEVQRHVVDWLKQIKAIN